jgi:hypothetical protein
MMGHGPSRRCPLTDERSGAQEGYVMGEPFATHNRQA